MTQWDSTVYMYYCNLRIHGADESVCGLLIRSCIRVIIRVHTGVLEGLCCLTVAQYTAATTFSTGPT